MVRFGAWIFCRRQKKKKETSVTLLYHSRILDLFNEHNNTQILALTDEQEAELPKAACGIAETPLYKLFMDIAQSYINFYTPTGVKGEELKLQSKFEPWALESTQIVTQKYYECLRQRVKNVWYPQNRLQIQMRDGDFWSKSEGVIPVPAGPSLPAMSWKDFSVMVRRQCGGDNLLRVINSILTSVMPMGADAENDHSFIAPNGTRYRVLLMQHQRYGTNKRDFILSFVPTISRNPGGDRETSEFVGAIMLASKYRFMFLEKDSPYSVEAFKSLDELQKLKNVAKKMVRDMDRVIIEAADDGLSDKNALLKLLGEDSDDVKEMFDTWWPALDRFKEETKSFLNNLTHESRGVFLEALGAFISLTVPINHHFIRLCLDGYQRRLGM
jgi:hypothetical protein